MCSTPLPFFESLSRRVRQVDSLLCVGLDPHRAELEEDSAHGAFRFCAKLIAATKEVAAAYKPNVAFFEAFGHAGVDSLEQVLKMVPEDIPIILDAKRGDIGSTAEAYAQAAFDSLRCGSVTVSPYLGGDSLEPFFRRPEAAAWVLCKTSNPGSAELQALEVAGEPLYLRVAKLCWTSWAARYHNVGLVVGATDVDALRRVRAELPEVWLLAPGIGAQLGNVEQATAAGLRADGLGLLFPVSRGLSGAPDPKAAAEIFRAEMNRCRDVCRHGA